MAAPEIFVARIKRFCHERAPAHLRDEMRLEVSVRGDSVTIWERRPPITEGIDDWTRMKIAPLRYLAAGKWALYWPDHRGRRHHYNIRRGVVLGLEEALNAVDTDELNVFFG